MISEHGNILVRDSVQVLTSYRYNTHCVMIHKSRLSLPFTRIHNTITSRTLSQVGKTMEWIPEIDLAPPLDSEWLKHEHAAGLLFANPNYGSIFERRAAYNQACRDRNAAMLGGRDSHLYMFPMVEDSFLKSRDGYEIRIRIYTPPFSRQGESSILPVIIYYHGGETFST